MTTPTERPVYFAAQCTGLNLFENASFMGYGLDSSYNVIMNQPVTLTTDQYNEWKRQDDSYIIKLVSEAIQNAVLTETVDQTIKETVEEFAKV